MAEQPARIVQLEEEIEGDRRGTKDFVFRRIGESVPLKPTDSAFDLEDPPSQPLAVSEPSGALFLAHSEGFLVARTKDVIGIAKEIKAKGKGPCIQGSSVADVRIGRVSILALSNDSSTLAAIVGGDICFYSVASLLNKEQEPLFSCSIGEACTVKDFKWRKSADKSFVIRSSHSSLYHGYLNNHPKDVMGNVDAVDWSMEGDFIAVAKENTLSILSSNFKEKCHFSLLFNSWPTIKVDSINWARDDSIIVGCVRVDEDGNENGYLVQVVTSREHGFTESLCIPVVYSFPDLFGGIDDGILPTGCGPYLLLSYLDRWELALASNKRAIDDHFLLLGWLIDDNSREVVSLDFQNDMFPRIELQENGDDNLIMGLGVDKISLYEKVTVQVGSDIEERSPYCILLCLTVEGKLIMFHAVRISEPSDLHRTSLPLLEDYNSTREKIPTTISFENEMQTTSSRLKDDLEGKKPESYGNLETSKVGVVDIPSGKKEQGSGGSAGQIANANQLLVESPHMQGSGSAVRNNSKGGTQEILFSSSSRGVNTTLSMGNMSSEASSTMQASANRITRSAEMSKGTVGSISAASFGSQSTGTSFVKDGSNAKSSAFSFSTSILTDAQGKTEIGKGDKSLVSPQISPLADHLSGGRPFSLKGSTRESSSSMFSSNKVSSNAGRSASVARATAETLPTFQGSPVWTQEGFLPGKSLLSNTQPVLNRTSKPPQVLGSEPEISKQFYNVKDMVKELDILLSSIEQEGGFMDACTLFQKSSFLALEEGLENIFEISRRCKNKVEEQLVQIQQLQNKMLQVSARQVYMEGLVKQASNDQYWYIWNRQKLNPEFELKRQNILKAYQNLANQLIELERHFNTLEINRFGDTSRVPTGRRASHSSSEPSRQSQSFYSVYNTLNSQLAVAQQLSECVSNQMAVLNLNSPSVKQKNVAKELFESIGLTHGDTAFQSPDFKTLGLTPDYKRVSLSPPRTIKEHPRRNMPIALKNSEPETARRRRDSLDRSLAGFEPQKTTVKRMLQGGHLRASEDKPLRITKEAFASQMEGFSIVQPKSNETPAFSSSQSLTSKFQSDAYSPSKGIFEKPSKAFESQSNSVFRWAKEPSSSSFSLESKSHPVQVLDGGTQQSLSLGTSSSLHSSAQIDMKKSSLPDMSSTGVTRLGSQSNSSIVKPVSISKTISNMQFGTSIPSLASSNVSSSVSPKMTSLTAKGSASEQLNAKVGEDGEQLNAKVGEDGLTRSLQKLTKESTVSPEGLSAISDESNISSLSSISTVSSAGLNRNADQVDGIASKNQPTAVSAPSKISASDTSFLPTSSASPTSSIFSTSVTPSLPSPLFTPVAFGGSSLNSKPFEQTYQATSVLSSTLAASSQSILSSSSPSSFQFQISPLSTSPVESAISQPLSSHTIDVNSRTMLTSALAPSSVSSLHQSEINSKLKPDTSQVPAGEVSDGFASKSEPSLLSTNIGSMFPATSNSAPEMPSAMAPISTVTTTEKHEGVDINASQEEDMEEEAPETTAVLNLGALGGFGLGSTPPSIVPKSNPFGGSFVTANASSANSLLSHTASPGELFRPASFNLPSAQPVQQTQAINTSGMGGGFSGFGQPAQLGSGQQALGSVLGSFGQSRQLNTGVPGFGFASSGGFGGGGFSASANHGGFASAGGFIGAASSGGFAGAAKGVGFGTVSSSGGGFAGAANGGGFAAAASGGGFAGATSAVGGFGGGGAGSGFTAGGFGAFSSNQGGGFSVFGNSVTGAGKPPAELLTQMRK